MATLPQVNTTSYLLTLLTYLTWLSRPPLIFILHLHLIWASSYDRSTKSSTITITVNISEQLYSEQLTVNC